MSGSLARKQWYVMVANDAYKAASLCTDKASRAPVQPTKF